MLDGLATLPRGEPEFTLGYGVLAHAIKWIVQPDGEHVGEPWTPTEDQIEFILQWYAVDSDGRWVYSHGCRRLAKGSGKSPFAAVLAIEEFVGPVRFSHFDPSVPGGAVGKQMDMALVQIAATAESQTANTMRVVRQMLQKGSRIAKEYGIDPGVTKIYADGGRELQIITSSAATAEGALVTFVVEDETEHWTPSMGGPKLAAVLSRNLSKSNSRAIETANAWEPGSESVAEATYEAYRLQQEGRRKGKQKILYDARVAPADTKLGDRKSLTAALKFVYKDCPWVDITNIIEHIWDTRNEQDDSRRFYLNQPTAAEDAWVTPMEWASLEKKTRRVKDGEAIVMFFDGSKSHDATGLVGCCMSDGHVFTIGGWEPNTKGKRYNVPVREVDSIVDRAFAKWDVVAFFADVREWEGFTKDTWPARYKDKLIILAIPGGVEPQAIAWDMRTKDYLFTAATELVLDEIHDRVFTHDGSPMMARHVEHARRRNRRYGTIIGKESKNSSKKIDLAVCMIGARMVRRKVLSSKEWQKRVRRQANKTRKATVYS